MDVDTLALKNEIAILANEERLSIANELMSSVESLNEASVLEYSLSKLSYVDSSNEELIKTLEDVRSSFKHHADSVAKLLSCFVELNEYQSRSFKRFS